MFGEVGVFVRFLGGRVGVLFWFEYLLEGDSVRFGERGGRRELFGDKLGI